ncbi:carbohydrate esterase family 5 protein [Hypoxylon crocopeplum]|nr:carbohydrate esterase family 5 protein [Hypoxylon crocopeplum]
MHAVLRSTALSGLVAFFCSSLTSLASAAAIINRRDAAVSANEWDSVLQGEKGATCAELAVIFARGTFDEGNIGPWVGGPFRDALVKKSSGIKIAVQGVSVDDYPANLAGYVEEGGSSSCASSLGQAVQKYVSHCPDSKVAVWGWSQGAQCAHKAMGQLGSAAPNVVALGVFGDPAGIWQDSVDYPAIPKGTTLLSYCEKTTPDPLCANPTEDFPTDPIAFMTRLRDIWQNVESTHMNDAQKEAVGHIIEQLPKQLLQELGKLAKDISEGHLRRWMLTPQHFWYGIDDSVATAADDLIRVYKDLY